MSNRLIDAPEAIDILGPELAWRILEKTEVLLIVRI
jgi:hypothetical protein